MYMKFGTPKLKTLGFIFHVSLVIFFHKTDL